MILYADDQIVVGCEVFMMMWAQMVVFWVAAP
jgi:hypothetical protein